MEGLRTVELHDRRLVAASVAVVWRREESQNTIPVLPLEPLHDELVSAHNELHSVFVVVRLSDVLAKRVPSSPGRDAPAVPGSGFGV